MECIILAGGLGTRLQPIVNNVPKPMAPIGNKPFLEYILQWVAGFNISKIVISVGYKANIIKDYFKDSYNKIPIVYAEELTPLGTGGAISYAASFTSNADLFVINGDTWFPIPLDQLLDLHLKYESSISLALKEMKDFDRYGTITLNKNKITGFNEKQYRISGLINGGIYVINKAILNDRGFPNAFSFEKEVLEKRVSEGALNGKVFNQIFIDIGVPQDYQKACKIL